MCLEYLYIQPLRRPVNIPAYCSQPIPSPIVSDDNHRKYSMESSNNEEFRTPDLLRLAGIEYSSPDDGYETNPSPILNSICDSRFFPISIKRHQIYSNPTSHQVSHYLKKIDRSIYCYLFRIISKTKIFLVYPLISLVYVYSLMDHPALVMIPICTSNS